MKVGDRVTFACYSIDNVLRGSVLRTDAGAFEDRCLVRWDDGGQDRTLSGGLSQIPPDELRVIGILDLIIEGIS